MLKRAKNAGIYIPEDDVNKEQVKQIEGTLVSAGGDCFKKWQGLIPKEGDRIMYDLYAGSNITLDGKKHQIINDTDVIAVIG
jgi:co-chaperonin GroES (HSP10)